MNKIIVVGFIDKGTGAHQSNLVYSPNGLAPTVCASFCVKQPPPYLLIRKKHERDNKTI